jgi:hypothetical protein
VQVGDLVKRTGQDWYAIVVEMKTSNGYIYPKFVWLGGAGEIDSCSASLLEVISESR